MRSRLISVVILSAYARLLSPAGEVIIAGGLCL